MNDRLLSELDRRVIAITGYGARRGFGEAPALVIVDAQNKFVGLDRPILESMAVYPLSIGEKAWRAVERIEGLLAIARRRDIPVFWSTSGVPVAEMPFNSFARKRLPHEKEPRAPKDGGEIVAPLRPAGSGREWVVDKKYASAFFGTPLITFLNTLRRDTLVVAGFVTSGCVRALTVDAASYNFNVAVVEDAVADRFDFAHDLNLIDMNLKYADVIGSVEAAGYLEGIG